ncbi:MULTISPECIES: rRNA maturation RNase YbeY [Glycomyces]|uniref:Endoribonuclease YbeY n=1 Tax=Glycomyces artemisiae TaxID=1076443 RepID=A0A2T0UJ88_9ACTN|nr:rRNA maturation RNase YbeY [Glycomyces artemisiae]NUQ87032.1 rRNA maturation RNase YbeY [Glycomyces artemisiae]PRY57944.1 putative rRNA maturation factor [Glycomyces artemisiae]
MGIEIINESGRDVDEAGIRAVAEFALLEMGVNPLAELSVLIVDIEHMTELNKRWMGGSGPTDVLSFPMDDAMPARPDSSEPGTPILGDLVLSPEVAEAQAKDAGHSTADEMHMLSVHGVLHILGYDHAEPEQAKEMFGLQNRLLDSWRARRTASAES